MFIKKQSFWMSFSRSRLPRNSSGYTLLELALVLSLLAVISGALAPIGLYGFRSLDLKFTANSFAQELGAARLQALSENSAIAVRVDPVGDAFQLVSAKDPSLIRGPQRFLGNRVFFGKVPQREVVFHPWGTAAPSGTYQLFNDTGKIQIVVSITGRIRMERVTS